MKLKKKKRELYCYHFKHNKNDPKYHLNSLTRVAETEGEQRGFYEPIDSDLYFAFFSGGK